MRLLSVHGSKGLEFEAVHVNNVNADDYGPRGRYWEPPADILEIVPPEVLGSTAKVRDLRAWVLGAVIFVLIG